jgi:predicted RNase H-like nuclease (RuvC/YqgF family)
MKKTIFTLAITMIIAGTIFTGCELTTKKTENTPDQMQKSTNDDEGSQHMGTTMMAKDSISEYQQFKKESEEKIDDFEKSIAEFKTKIANAKAETKAEYEKKLTSLEQKDNALKKKLEEYKEDGQDNWSKFKSEFSHDMDELGIAIKDLTIINVK